MIGATRGLAACDGQIDDRGKSQLFGATFSFAFGAMPSPLASVRAKPTLSSRAALWQRSVAQISVCILINSSPGINAIPHVFTPVQGLR